jgi:hypothetical protein
MNLLQKIGIIHEIIFNRPSEDRYSNMSKYSHYAYPAILIDDTIGLEHNRADMLKEDLIHLNLDLNYASTGNADELTGCAKVNDIHDNKYIFHDFKDGPLLCKTISKYIKLPYDILSQSAIQLRIQRLYYGNIKTGAHLHNHSAAINYLLKGSKLWIIFPPLLKNVQFVINNNFKYGNIHITVLDWLNQYLPLLKERVHNYNIFVQNENEIVYVPTGYFHMVINLNEVLGVTFSWSRIE